MNRTPTLILIIVAIVILMVLDIVVLLELSGVIWVLKIPWIFDLPIMCVISVLMVVLWVGFEAVFYSAPQYNPEHQFKIAQRKRIDEALQ